MSLNGAKRRIAMFCVNHFLAGIRFFGLKRCLLRTAGHEIGSDSKLVGPIFCTGKLRVGNGTWIGKNLTVHGNGTVEIGDSCDIAPEVMFITGGHRIGAASRRAGEGESYTVTVGNGTWVGARSTIGRNVHIGSGCVVAACACVMEDVPDNVMVGGVPAKLMRELPNEAE